MQNNNNIISRKKVNPLAIKQIFDESQFVITATHSGFTISDFNTFRDSLSKLGLKVKQVKNKPLIKFLEETKYNSFTSLFQGNTILLYSYDKNINYNQVYKTLCKNKNILMTGMLIDGVFLSTTMMKSLLVKNPLDNMSEFYSLLKYSTNRLVNQGLMGKIPSLLFSLDHIKKKAK